MPAADTKTLDVPYTPVTGYVPTSVMYIFYGGFVVYGFVQWVRISRAERPGGLSDPAVEAVA